MRIYIAGPMTGIADWNFPAFDAAAAAWRAAGWDVENPAEHFDRDTTLPYSTYVESDIKCLAACDAVALLPGWDGPTARGSVWEAELAAYWGKPRLAANSPIPPDPDIFGHPESPLAEADRLVSGDRQESYGHPIEDFARTGRMWGAILGIADVDPALVGLCMAALKISRECHRPKRDSVVDLAGYAKTVWLVRQAQGAYEAAK